MTRLIAVAAAVVSAANLSITASSGVLAQEPTLAPEGRGLLPIPTVTTPEEPASPYLFKADPSGGLSRTVFETADDPNFRILIRDYSFPPDHQVRTLILSDSAFVHLARRSGEIRVGKRPLETRSERFAVSADTPIEVVNNGEYPLVLRVIILKAK
jgi:hypothetical protein